MDSSSGMQITVKDAKINKSLTLDLEPKDTIEIVLKKMASSWASNLVGSA